MWTLVRHTGFSIGGKRAFEHAVEVRQINSKKDQTTIQRLGGMLFEDYDAARTAEEDRNYPDGVGEGLIPQAKGKFLGNIDGEQVFVPDVIV